MKHKQTSEQIKKIISDGICEVTLIDPYSVEFKVSVTLSSIHLPISKLDENNNLISNKQCLEVWDVINENYYNLKYRNIIDIEQLTGENAPCNQSKLKPCEDYFIEEMWWDNDIEDIDIDIDIKEL
jgi:hypothetical protein